MELTSQQEASFALQTQLEGVTVEHNSLKKEIEKLGGKLGALSDPDFSIENFSFLTNILQFSICNIFCGLERQWCCTYNLPCLTSSDYLDFAYVL